MSQAFETHDTSLPISIEFAGSDQLRIKWSDRSTRVYRFAELRNACPCATCREKKLAEESPKTSLPILSAAEAAPIKVLQMRPVGNYAYSIAFSDEHNTGIYTMDLLRSLGTEVTN